METTYLQEYVRIADRGSFTAAARELHLTQSTLSKHVAVLEREFGIELFVRDRAGISLTEAGRLLYQQALQFDALLNQTKALVGSARNRHDHAHDHERPEAPPSRDMALRCACRKAAERRGLDEREAGALILYLEERGFEAIQAELGLTRDEVAEVLGSVYRKLGVSSKQEALDFIHSVSE